MANSIAKVFCFSLLIFFGLNAVFLALMILFGNMAGGASAEEVFGSIGNDLGGFLTALFTPGGHQDLMMRSAKEYLSDMFMAEDIGQVVVGNAIGILWLIVPGLVAAIVTGKKFAQESSKAAFWGNLLAIFLLSVLPMVLLFVPTMGASAEGLITANFVPYMYWTAEADGTLIVFGLGKYLWIVLAGFFNSLTFAGISAASCSNL